VEVEVENSLPTSRAAAIEEVDALGSKFRVHGLRDPLGYQCGCRQIFRRHAEKVATVLFRNDEKVAICSGIDVHEGQRRRILGNLVARYPPGDDLAEYARVIRSGVDHGFMMPHLTALPNCPKTYRTTGTYRDVRLCFSLDSVTDVSGGLSPLGLRLFVRSATALGTSRAHRVDLIVDWL